jgi:hypothetical protein
MLPNSFILLEMRLTSRSNNGGELPIEIERAPLEVLWAEGSSRRGPGSVQLRDQAASATSPTLIRLSTNRTPGAFQAARSASSRSNNE